VNFVGTLGFSIVIPFLVFLVTKYGGNGVVYGVLGATYSFFQLIGAPLLGNLSDTYGRKKILFVSQLGTLLSWILILIALLMPTIKIMEVRSQWLGSFVFTVPLFILFLGRALDGLTGGNISVANAYLVDISSPENQKANFGKMAASSNLGFILGPALAGILGVTVLAEKLPVIVAVLVSAVALFLIVKLPETRTTPLAKSPCENPNRRLLGKEIKDCFDQKIKKSYLTTVLAVPKLPFMLFMYFLIFLAFNVFYTAFPVHALKRLNWEMSSLGLYFSFLSGVMIFVQGPVLTRMGARFSDEKLVMAGALVMVFSFSLMTINKFWAVTLAAVLFAVGNGVMWPSFLSQLGNLGHKGEKGLIQGVASSSGSLASILGLIMGGGGLHPHRRTHIFLGCGNLRGCFFIFAKPCFQIP